MRVSVDTTKKKKEPEQSSTKKTFKLLWKSLFKNAAVVEAKDTPWYIAIICFFVSVILSFIPPVTSAATEKGSFILTNTTYQMDVGLEAFSRFIYDNKIEFTINKTPVYSTNANGSYILDDNGEKIVQNYENKLSLNTVSFWEDKTKTVKHNDNDVHYYEYCAELSDGTSKPRFRVFYVPGSKDSSGYSESYKFFTNNETFGITKEESTIAPTSMMVLGTYDIYFAIYAPTASKNTEYSGNTFRGDYSRMDASKGIHLQSLLLSSNANEEEITNANNFAENPSFVSPEKSKWISFLNEAYSITRINNTIMMFSLIGGINSLIILVFGFTLWILTRGKHNPNNYIKLSETIKMSCISAVSPAILSLITGLLVPSFSTLSFMLFASFRLMWLSMKTLRPSYE